MMNTGSHLSGEVPDDIVTRHASQFRHQNGRRIVIIARDLPETSVYSKLLLTTYGRLWRHRRPTSLIGTTVLLMYVVPSTQVK